MGCNCGGGNKVAMNYVYVPPTGPVKVYTTEVEARAAVIRSGGTYSAKPR